MCDVFFCWFEFGHILAWAVLACARHVLVLTCHDTRAVPGGALAMIEGVVHIQHAGYDFGIDRAYIA